jgi:hypothetical protein
VELGPGVAATQWIKPRHARGGGGCMCGAWSGGGGWSAAAGAIGRQRGGGSCPSGARSEASGVVTIALGQAQFGAQSIFSNCSKIAQILQIKYAAIPKSKNLKNSILT